jgi:hypothetical protein
MSLIPLAPFSGDDVGIERLGACALRHLSFSAFPFSVFHNALSSKLLVAPKRNEGFRLLARAEATRKRAFAGFFCERGYVLL